MTDTSGNAPANEPNGTDNGDQGGTDNGQGNEPTVADLQAKIDELTKHSRKWEERAKANKDAADRLTALEEANLTAEQKATKALQTAESRATEAEERANAAEAALARYKIAVEFGLSQEDSEALEKVQADEDTLRTLAKRFADADASSKNPRAPRPNPSQGKKGGASMTAEESFGAFLDQF